MNSRRLCPDFTGLSAWTCAITWYFFVGRMMINETCFGVPDFENKPSCCVHLVILGCFCRSNVKDSLRLGYLTSHLKTENEACREDEGYGYRYKWELLKSSLGWWLLGVPTVTTHRLGILKMNPDSWTRCCDCERNLVDFWDNYAGEDPKTRSSWGGRVSTQVIPYIKGTSN